MPSAAGAAHGSILAPAAGPQPPGALSARRSTPWQTTDAQSKGARSREATRAHTGWSSAGTTDARISPRQGCSW